EARRGTAPSGAGDREGGDAAPDGPARDAELVPPGRLARSADAPHLDPRQRAHARAQQRHPVAGGSERPDRAHGRERMSRGSLEPDRVEVDVAHLAASVIAEARDGTHPVELTTPGPVFARVDVAQTERIIENLVTNAIRYTPPSTPIWVRVAEHED